MATVKSKAELDLSVKDLAIGFVGLVAFVFIAKKLNVGTSGQIALGVVGVVGGVYASQNLTKTSKLA